MKVTWVKQLLDFSTVLNGPGEDLEGGWTKHAHGYCEICGAEGTEYQEHWLTGCDAVYCGVNLWKYTDAGNSMSFRNAGKNLPNYTPSYIPIEGITCTGEFQLWVQ
jgi:hypothetical protein